MKFFSFTTYLFVALLFIACSDSPTDNGNADPIPAEVPTPSDIKAADGVQRVKISWTQQSQADIAKSIIYWNNRQSYKTATFKAQGNAEVQRDSIFIERLDEGDYTFEIVNVDKNDNKSAYKSITAHAYGEEYISELQTRPVEEFVYDKEAKSATISWQEDWSLGLGTEVMRNDAETEPIWVPNSESTTLISQIEAGAKLNVQTLYCPDNCIDTMRAEALTLTIKVDDEGEGDEGDEGEEDTRPLTDPANVKAFDGFKRVKLTWEQQVESSIDKTLILWGLTEDQTYEKSFEPTEQSGTQTEEVILDLPEGEYTFSIVNVDKAGNKTEAVEVKARAYGDAFVATLATRAVNSFSYNATSNKATLSLGAASPDAGMVNTKATYSHITTGEQVSKTIRNSATDTTCDNIGPGEQIEIFSVYRFDNCIDDITSNPIIKTTDHLIDVKVMQLNICRDQSLGSYNWAERKAAIAALVREQQPDVICLQEINPYDDAFNDILGQLNNSYDKSSWTGDIYSGTLCNRGTTIFLDDEGDAVIYRNSKFTLKNRGVFWLSNTPEKESRMEVTVEGTTYKANYNRIAVWNILQEKTSGKEFCVVATHIDNKNDSTQESLGFPIMWQQVQICVNNVEAKAKDANGNALPIIIAGDMNANPDKAPILRFTNTNKYTDTYVVAQNRSCPDSSKPRSTMVDVDGASATQNWAAFDYIFAKGGVFTVPNHTIHAPKYDGTTLSDHNAVSAVIRYQVSAE